MSPARRSTVLPGVMSSVRWLDTRMEASVLVSARIRAFYGGHAPIVESLLDTSAALIDSIPGSVPDVDGVDTRPCARELLGINALETCESIHCNDFNANAPASD